MLAGLGDGREGSFSAHLDTLSFAVNVLVAERAHDRYLVVTFSEADQMQHAIVVLTEAHDLTWSDLDALVVVRCARMAATAAGNLLHRLAVSVVDEGLLVALAMEAAVDEDLIRVERSD